MPNRYPENISGLSDDELRELKDRVEVDLNGVKMQIEEAKGNATAYGEYRDPSWFARANGAKRFYGIIHQKILTEIASRRKKAGNDGARRIENCFMRVAREVLDEADFQYIFEEARKEANA